MSTSWKPGGGILQYTQPPVTPAVAGTTIAANNTANAAMSGSTPRSTVQNANLTSSNGTGTSSNQNRALNNNELVSNQITNITSADSPLLQQTQARAFQNANSRGLLNSSMANESALGAVLDRATPIAQANANTMTNLLDKNLANDQQTSMFNAGQVQNNNQFNASNANDVSKFNATNANQNNQFNANLNQSNNQFNAGNQQQTNLQNANNANQVNQFNAAEANKTSIVNATEQNAVLKQFMDQGNKLQLADIEASYKVVLQSEASAGTLYQQSVRNISDILQNPDLTPQAKTAAVTNQNELLRTGLNILGKIGGLNLDGLLNFPSA